MIHRTMLCIVTFVDIKGREGGRERRRERRREGRRKK
jgi:hypothetical protein